MYSKRVRFTAIAAGLLLAQAMRSGIHLAIDMHGGVYSVRGLFKKYQFLIGLISACVGIVVGTIAMYYARVERRLEQEQRDRVAERLVAQIERQFASPHTSREIQPF